MIIDKIQLAGLEAYFNNAGQINLGGQNPSTARTKLLGKGKQIEISAITLLIESDQDLAEMFKFNAEPLFSITVMKEMFPVLFADPFRHRVHTISGFEDFKRGELKNGKVLDIEGIPTIVSVGTETCKWESPIYPMPEPVWLKHASWELAASRKTSRENFTYSLNLQVFGPNRNPIQQAVALADTLDPTQPRMLENFDLREVSFYQVEFTADVKKDATIYEKHSSISNESIGTPLLRAVNLLEPVESIYNIYSLQELLNLSSEYHLFEFQGQPLRKMLVTLDLSATLVHSENEDIQNGKFEFVEIAVRSDRFSNVEARLIGEVLTKPNVK